MEAVRSTTKTRPVTNPTFMAYQVGKPTAAFPCIAHLERIITSKVTSYLPQLSRTALMWWCSAMLLVIVPVVAARAAYSADSKDGRPFAQRLCQNCNDTVVTEDEQDTGLISEWAVTTLSTLEETTSIKNSEKDVDGASIGNAINDTKGVIAVASLCSEGSCRCTGAGEPSCPEGVSVVKDGCNCCSICARQQGDTCNAVQLCDARRQLHCVYSARNATSGTCKVVQGQACQVEGGGQYKDGATFKLDCRTQCSCQNGTYGCVSLCPHEGFRPSAECRNARLVRLRGNCCREWLCDHEPWKQPRSGAGGFGQVARGCDRHASEWSPCSATCGVGVSRRVAVDSDCRTRNETRICILRPCDATGKTRAPGARHRTRRNHLCRATVRASCPQHYTDGFNCTTVKPYQPKFCGNCPGRRCCFPSLANTIHLDFKCFEDGEWTVRKKDVMSIMRCRCKSKC
ncbi:CCN family member 2-like [Ornithodoros turicata]|uniref:CCN family member 2-like n=1 Tax=Ornithodoros turicata TaxID=34597 RepID=UPI003139D26F